ncbi:nuclear transport factor 2 family protein [Terrabacter terrigena]|uniref:Nuclear transport factor 2 family protein n=1 Tax=Terrabacter terrigena TaxID=574718 RepID=A0ABW3MSK5_9MICO
MTSTHDHQRALLARAFEELVHGDAAALGDISAPDVSWWLPLGGPEHCGISNVVQALDRALAGKEVATQTVVLGADSRSAVVEQLVRVAKGVSTPVTSVLTLRHGLVAAGRTYLDVAAWQGENTDAGSATVMDPRRG